MSLERFTDGAIGTVVSPCATCAHKNPLDTTCSAFKSGIPLNILTGRHSHKKPYPGDNGIVYSEQS